MLGHADGLARAAWPSFDPEVAKADEVVVPVQVNGKVRAPLTVPAGAVRRQLRELRARRRGGDGAHRRQDDPQGRRRERTAGQRGGVVRRPVHWTLRNARRAAVLCALCVLCGRSVGMRLRAGRPRLVPARLHPDDRRPDLRQPHDRLQPRNALTQKVRAEFIGRGKYQILPEADRRRRAADRRGDRRRRSRRSSFTPAAARVALRDHDDRADRAARPAREQGALGEPQPHVPPGVRGAPSGTTRTRSRRRSFGRTRTRSSA